MKMIKMSWVAGVLAFSLLTGFAVPDKTNAQTTEPVSKTESTSSVTKGIVPDVNKLMTVTCKQGDEKQVYIVTEPEEFENILYLIALASVEVQPGDQVKRDKETAVYTVQYGKKKKVSVQLAQVESGEFCALATLVGENGQTRWGDQGLIETFDRMFL